MEAKQTKDQMPAALKAGLIGAAVGAAMVLFIGFAVAGWTTQNTASAGAKAEAHIAVVAALAPICAQRFKAAADAAARLDDLKKQAPGERGFFIEKGGWATMPGNTVADDDVAAACATLLLQTNS